MIMRVLRRLRFNICSDRRYQRRVMVPSRIGLQSSNFGTYCMFWQILHRRRKNAFRRSDSVYMVPPFLAYYGMTTNNQSMLQEAYTRVRVLKNSIPPIGSNVRRVTWW